jgi:hypothetical protein
MLDNDCNILVNMTKAEYKDFRALMVDMVLHTGNQKPMYCKVQFFRMK